MTTPIDPTSHAATSPPPVSASSAAKAARTGGASILNVLLGVAVLVATAGVAFAVGRTTATASQTAFDRPGSRTFVNGGPNASFDPNAVLGGPGNGNGFGRFGFGGAASIEGTVDSITADSITIRTANGSTVTFGLDSSTTYHQQADATASDVQAGSTVRVQLAGGGFRPGQGGNSGNGNGGNGNIGNGNGGTIDLGNATDVTVVP